MIQTFSKPDSGPRRLERYSLISKWSLYLEWLGFELICSMTICHFDNLEDWESHGSLPFDGFREKKWFSERAQLSESDGNFVSECFMFRIFSVYTSDVLRDGYILSSWISGNAAVTVWPSFVGLQKIISGGTFLRCLGMFTHLPGHVHLFMRSKKSFSCSFFKFLTGLKMNEFGI